MVDYKTVNVKAGSEVDEYLTELVEDDGPIQNYTHAGNYVIRKQMQREEYNNE